MASRNVPLATLFSNPALRDAFQRADRDRGTPAMVPAPVNPSLIGSAGAAMTWRAERELLVVRDA